VKRVGVAGGQTRVAVVGPGAIGAATAALVRRAGANPILCGRTPLERIVVEREGGGEEVVPGPVITDHAAIPWRADLVLLAVKAHQTEAAAPFLRALSGPGTVVVALQNGVEQRAQVGPHAPGATVLPAVVWFPVERLAPDRVLVRDDPRITLPDEPAARPVAELLDAVELAGDFATHAWRKLAVNAVAGLMVLSGRRAEMFRRPDVRALARALAAECLAVARAEGADLSDTVADELADEFASYPEDLGSSILFDREAGRELEWDARNGVVARLGARHGIPTAVSDVIVPLLAAASAP
jgi:2-dehydropantoate 2-reductase